MEDPKKEVSISINLPVESVQTFIDTTDKAVEVPIEDVISKMRRS